MTLSDLIKDPGTGRLSHSKIWANVAYAAGTVVFLRSAFDPCAVPDADVWLIYLGVVGSHCAVSKFISARYGAGGGRGYGRSTYSSSGYGGHGVRDDLRSPAYRDDPEGP